MLKPISCNIYQTDPYDSLRLFSFSNQLVFSAKKTNVDYARDQDSQNLFSTNITYSITKNTEIIKSQSCSILYADQPLQKQRILIVHGAQQLKKLINQESIKILAVSEPNTLIQRINEQCFVTATKTKDLNYSLYLSQFGQEEQLKHKRKQLKYLCSTKKHFKNIKKLNSNEIIVNTAFNRDKAELTVYDIQQNVSKNRINKKYQLPDQSAVILNEYAFINGFFNTQQNSSCLRLFDTRCKFICPCLLAESRSGQSWCGIFNNIQKIPNHPFFLLVKDYITPIKQNLVIIDIRKPTKKMDVFVINEKKEKIVNFSNLRGIHFESPDILFAITKSFIKFEYKHSVIQSFKFSL